MLKEALFIATASFAAQSWAQDVPQVDETRKTALQLASRLQSALQEEMKKGPDSAVGVCKDLAPKFAGELSLSTGWHISRVSLKVRNPLLGSADSWETAALTDFDKRAAAADDVAKLERSEIVTEAGRRYLRYIKALPVQPVCLTCHGNADDIPSAVKAKLAAEYPHDRATGYVAGQIRGGVSVKRPL
jgi:hypothetical protein